MSVETVTIETVETTSTANEVVANTVTVESIVVGVTGPQGPSGSGGGGNIAVKESGTAVVATATTLDFGAGFDVTESPTGEANIALDLTEYGTGTPDNTTFLRGDGTWASPGGGVTSVNGETGAVSLSAADVGADPTGTATTAVANHEADTTNVHGIADTSALVTTTSAPELIRDTIGSALVAGSNITITVSDPSDTITIAASGGVTDAYKTATDGTTNAVASGADTLKFRSSDGSVTVTVTSNDPTHGDNVNFQIGGLPALYVYTRERFK